MKDIECREFWGTRYLDNEYEPGMCDEPFFQEIRKWSRDEIVSKRDEIVSKRDRNAKMMTGIEYCQKLIRST